MTKPRQSGLAKLLPAEVAFRLEEAGVFEPGRPMTQYSEWKGFWIYFSR